MIHSKLSIGLLIVVAYFTVTISKELSLFYISLTILNLTIGQLPNKYS